MNVLLIAGSGGDRGALEPLPRENSCTVCCNKRKFILALIREVEATKERNDFRSVYCITKKLTCGGNLSIVL